MNRVRHLRHQRPIPPPVPLLEQHHPHVGLQRNRGLPLRQHRPADLFELPTPTLHQRQQELLVGQQHVQSRQIRRQRLNLDRQHVVPQALRLIGQERQHAHPFHEKTLHVTGILTVTPDGKPPSQPLSFAAGSKLRAGLRVCRDLNQPGAGLYAAGLSAPDHRSPKDRELIEVLRARDAVAQTKRRSLVWLGAGNRTAFVVAVRGSALFAIWWR
jgi:hypothetical protein